MPGRPAIQRLAMAMGLMLCPLGVADSLLYVDDDATPGGDGSSWLGAFASLQDALEAAAELPAGVEVRVAAGTYVPSTPADPEDARSATFALFDGITLRGGYAGPGAGGDPDARDVELHETILSGDLAGDDGSGGSTAENAYHVVTSVVPGAIVTLDGFTVTGGNAGVGAFPDPTASGGGCYFDSGVQTVTQCCFHGNFAISLGAGVFAQLSDTTVSACAFECNAAGDDETGGYGAGCYLREGSALVIDSLLIDNASTSNAGGLRGFEMASVMVIGCTFQGNAADVGGGIHMIYSQQVLLAGCSFLDNFAWAGGGGALVGKTGAVAVTGCQFRNNHGGTGGGGLVAGDTSFLDIVSSAFVANASEFIGGGVLETAQSTTVANCTFSRNASVNGGGLYTTHATDVINCSFSANAGGSIGVDSDSDLEVVNSILWGGDPEIYEDAPGGAVSVTFCDIQGGWSGEGNLDADPLFVQPGTDDLRLAYGSPCLDAGDDSALPADPFDLDGDGDVEEAIPFDLAGNPRVQGGAVDLGALEGAFEPMPQAAMNTNVDQGQTVVLVPTGGAALPPQTPVVLFTNVSGPDDATVIVTQLGGAVHPGAGGFTELGWVLALETSLEDGQFRATMCIPVEVEQLDGVDPLDLDLTRFNDATGRWSLAPTGNTQDSPGHDGPVGDRIVAAEPPWGLTQDVGDYGIYWYEVLGGFAWANVDRSGDYGMGLNLCPTDCAPLGGDGVTDVVDLSAVVRAWGEEHAGAVTDIDRDGLVDALDPFFVLESWGFCP